MASDGIETIDTVISININLVTSVQKREQFGLKVYPNPTNAYLYLSFSSFPTEGTEIELYNQEGKMLLRKQLFQPKEIIDMSRLTKGMYFLKLLSADSKLDTKKIILQ